MLEAKLAEAGILKKLLDGQYQLFLSYIRAHRSFTAIKELVTDANFECNEEGINLQAMDNSHVALVAVLLEATGFKRYRCDRPMPLGVNLTSLTKVLKCAKDDDICTLKAADEADVLNLVYESKCRLYFHNPRDFFGCSWSLPFVVFVLICDLHFFTPDSDRIAEYDMKLMDIDSDTLGIPDTDYDARVTLASSEFTRIVRDLSLLGESVRIEVSKEGVRFASEGEAANGSVLLKQSESAAASGGGSSSKKIHAKKVKAEDGGGDQEEEEDDDDGTRTKKSNVKKEKQGDGDVEMNGDDEEGDEDEFKPKSDEEGEEEQDKEEDDDDDEGESGKKRKKKVCSSTRSTSTSLFN